MKIWMAALLSLPISLMAAEMPKTGKYSAEAWQVAAYSIFYSNFSYDREIRDTTVISVVDAPKIVAESLTLSYGGRIFHKILFSTGFAGLVKSKDEFLFFLAHEVGHFKMDILGVSCGLCSDDDCEELAADRFAIDFMEAKGFNVCGGKTLLLKMILEGGADADNKRLQQLREHCLSPIAASN